MPNVIEVNNVSMHFRMTEDKLFSLKELLLKRIKGKIKHREFVALRDVSFSIPRGDVFGLVGLNGSGKSTMLKIVSGILKPTHGIVSTVGTIAPLIELGAGFDLELTARENIFLNGAVLGYSKAQILEKFDEIVEFSEMREFLDMPMKNYSSGMVARVAFAIATSNKPDILIADEILSVGDFKFQEKCENRMRDLMGGGTTVLLVSHAITQVEKLCKHAVWLDHGTMKMLGEANEVCAAYKGAA